MSGWAYLADQLAREWDFIEHTNAALDLLDPDQVYDAVLPEVTEP